MGFFDKKSTQTTDSTQTFNNPELRAYTESYRQSAPWSFQTLDPTATLAAMRARAGGNKGTNKNWDASGKYIGPAAFKKELQAQADAETLERESANAGLERIAERQKSGQFLTSQESDFINTQLDKAFEYAHKTGYADWEKATQMMAGSRGLRMSDTPAAEPALRELRNLEVGLGSKRAELQLGATLDFSKNQQLFDANFSSMLKQLGQNRWATKQGFLFGGGGQMASNLGFTNRTQGTTTTVGKASGFDKVMGSMGMASAGLDLVGKIGSMASGFAMPGGGASPGGGGWGGMMGMQSNPY